MAVGTYQDAFPSFLSIGRQRLSMALSDAETLRGWIYVMEVERDDAAGVAADDAAPAGLINQDPLDLLMTSRHRLAGAALALPPVPPLAVGVAMERDTTMPWALSELGGARQRRRPARLLYQRLWRRYSVALLSHEHMFAR